MAHHPTDMRKGVNTLCGQVRMLGLDPSDGKVYIFVDSSRKVMKILHWEHGGYVVYYKRLETSGSDPIVSKFVKKPAKWSKMKHRGLTPLFQNMQKIPCKEVAEDFSSRLKLVISLLCLSCTCSRWGR